MHHRAADQIPHLPRAKRWAHRRGVPIVVVDSHAFRSRKPYAAMDHMFGGGVGSTRRLIRCWSPATARRSASLPRAAGSTAASPCWNCRRAGCRTNGRGISQLPAAPRARNAARPGEPGAKVRVPVTTIIGPLGHGGRIFERDLGLSRSLPAGSNGIGWRGRIHARQIRSAPPAGSTDRHSARLPMRPAR